MGNIAGLPDLVFAVIIFPGLSFPGLSFPVRRFDFVGDDSRRIESNRQLFATYVNDYREYTLWETIRDESSGIVEYQDESTRIGCIGHVLDTELGVLDMYWTLSSILVGCMSTSG